VPFATRSARPSTRTASPGGSPRAALATLLAIVLAALAGVALTGTAGWAAPTATPEQARQQVDSLQTKMEQATEVYDAARVRLAQSKTKAAALQKQADAQQRTFNDYRALVDAMASSAYRSGNVSQFNSLMSSGSPQTFLDQVATLDQLGRDQRRQIQAMLAAAKSLADTRAAVNAEVARQQREADALARNKAAIEADLAKWRQLVAQYGPAPRADAASAVSYTGPASGRAAVAVRTAYAQLGKPYQWGGAGPNSFDCSGLTMYSWAAAGVSLPHSAEMQFNSGRQVARSDLQPGDLVFFGSPISHVGIFISGDTIIGAPTPGDVVRFQSISNMGLPYAGAVRP